MLSKRVWVRQRTIALAFGGLTTTALAGVGPIQIVATSPTYSISRIEPTVNNAGIYLIPSLGALYRKDLTNNSPVTLFAARDSAAQGGLPGDTWRASVRPIMDMSGRVASRYELASGRPVIAVGSGPPFQIVGRSDAPVADNPTELYNRDFSFPLMSPAGQIIFRATSDGGEGIWSHSPGQSTRTLLRSGWQAPGLSEGLILANTVEPAISNSGNIAVLGFLEYDVGVTPATANTVMLKTGDSFNTVLRGGQLIDGKLFYHAAAVRVNSRGRIAAWATQHSNGGQQGVLLGTPGNFRFIASTNERGPRMSPSESWGTGFHVIQNIQNTVLFFGQIRGGGGSGLWRQQDGQDLECLVRGGDILPGLPTGVTVSNLYRDDLVLNSRDEIVFRCVLTGAGVTAANDHAVYHWSAEDGFELILRKGQSIQIGLSALVVSDFNFIGGSGGDDGLPTSLNDRGDFGMTLEFVGGTSAMVAFTVPAPAAGLLLAAGVLARRRRR